MYDLVRYHEPDLDSGHLGKDLLSVSKTTNKRGEAACGFYAPHTWNKLPCRKLQVCCHQDLSVLFCTVTVSVILTSFVSCFLMSLYSWVSFA